MTAATATTTSDAAMKGSDAHHKQAGAGKRAWPGQGMVASDIKQSLVSLLSRRADTLTPDLRRAATEMGVPLPKRIRFSEQVEVRQYDPYRSRDAEYISPSDEAVIDDASEHAKAQEAVPPKHLHIGSSKPHAADGADAAYQRQDKWAPTGSLRQLEPEPLESLRVEPMPRTNIPRRTDPEEPPPRHVNPPGPFTSAELIPDAAIVATGDHHLRVVNVLDRASRGDQGWRVAKGLRPDALIMQESEALHERGWGYTWKRRQHEDKWDVLQPSHWPDDPPDGDLKAERFAELAERHGLLDKRVVSRVKHGFPGAVGMPSQTVVLGYPHVGALKHPAAYEERHQRDVKEGFVSHGQSFPHIWPCRVDPMNIVVQHDNPRLTIDKSMRLSSKEHPEGEDPYNSFIDNEADRQRNGEFKLVRVWHLSRSAAILATAGVEVVVAKFDAKAYFRMHGKQRAYVHQSGRLFRDGYGHDFRVNFGEKDAMDSTGDASNALAFFIRHELKRLDKAYPSRAASVVAWIEMRAGLAAGAGEEQATDFWWSVLFYFLIYVDDGGLTVINDELRDEHDKPVILLQTQSDGTITRSHQKRGQLYFEAAMGVMKYVGHHTPISKQFPPSTLPMDFLGVGLHPVDQLRRLSKEKRQTYIADAKAVRDHRQLPNGVKAAPRDDTKSLIHKLLHASEVIPLMRPHLFHLRGACQAGNEAHSLGWDAVLLGTKEQKELDWCIAQLEKSDDVGVPFAPRYDFPSSSDSTLVRYSDASREPDQPENKSGYGAWAVVRGIFIYVDGLWTRHEVRSYSINVLETKAKDMFGLVAIRYARERGCSVTHTLSFVDNSTAEHNAERGRTQSEALNQLNLKRLEQLTQLGVHEATERVASVDNDVADLLSRGDIEEALRFPRSLGLEVLRLHIPDADRSTLGLPTTWA